MGQVLSFLLACPTPSHTLPCKQNIHFCAFKPFCPLRCFDVLRGTCDALLHILTAGSIKSLFVCESRSISPNLLHADPQQLALAELSSMSNCPARMVCDTGAQMWIWLHNFEKWASRVSDAAPLQCTGNQKCQHYTVPAPALPSICGLDQSCVCFQQPSLRLRLPSF